MKKRLFQFSLVLLGIFLVHSGAMAQGVLLSASTQELGYVGKLYKGAKGSAFLYEDWAPGKIKLTDGTKFEGLKLMYDQVKDEVIFSVEENKPQKFLHPLQEFTIEEPGNGAVNQERKFRNGYPAIDGANELNFYEVLSEGKLQLLKRTSKAVVEERALNERVPSKQLKATERYYVYDGEKLIKIRKDKKSMLAALNNSGEAVETYVKKNDLNLKDEEDMVRLMTYYNSL